MSMPLQESPPAKVGMISLGCAKNLVDAEVMLGSVLQQGMELTDDPAEADVLVVNTCAFIDSAKEESVEAILEAHQQQGLNKRPGQRLIVSGCMSQRFSKELAHELPEVDAFIGLDQVADTGRIIGDLLHSTTPREHPLNWVTRRPRYIPEYDTPRFRLTPPHTAYVKIAEGCNHPCSFCVIPQMRGKHRSRSIESVVREVRQLVGEGVREFNLISQDTTYFGMDLWSEKAGPRQEVDSSRGPTLSRLIEELDQVEGDFWIRLLYTHPAHWSDELIRTLAQSRKTARYIDMPLQHIHPDMLQRMRRETSDQHIVDLVARIRAGLPGVTLRTTFIVGFPGETEEEFERLLEFIEQTRFERLGVFTYSQEEGSRAAKMPGQISERTKRARHRKAMLLQQKIAGEIAMERVGQQLTVLVEDPLSGRSEGDAPDVDGKVLLSQPAPVGQFVQARVTGTQVYDLVADPIL